VAGSSEGKIEICSAIIYRFGRLMEKKVQAYNRDKKQYYPGQPTQRDQS